MTNLSKNMKSAMIRAASNFFKMLHTLFFFFHCIFFPFFIFEFNHSWRTAGTSTPLEKLSKTIVVVLEWNLELYSMELYSWIEVIETWIFFFFFFFFLLKLFCFLFIIFFFFFFCLWTLLGYLFKIVLEDIEIASC